MTALTGVDLPLGSPGGSVELLRDLYLAPDAPLRADVFMLAPQGWPAGPEDPRSLACLDGPPERGYRHTVALAVTGKQVDGPGFWGYVADLSTAIRRRFAHRDYGVVHLQHLAFGATPALLRAFPDHPSLALVHGTDLLYAAAHRTQRDVLREAVARAGAVVVPTGAMADLLAEVAGGTPRALYQIPWGVPDQLLAAPPVRHPAPDGLLRLLYAGRLSAEKGADLLIEAFARVEDATLSVAAPRDGYRALSARTDVAGVRYLGWLRRRQLWREFADHDALVVPSTTLEAFGLVAVEAQACGLPVIYQPVPGLSEVLGDSALGADLASDRHALADAVTLLRKDPATLDDLRAAGYRNAARFPLSRTGREIGDLSTALQR